MGENKRPGGPHRILTFAGVSDGFEHRPVRVRTWHVNSLETASRMARGDRLGVERRFLGGLIAYRHLGIDLGDGTVVHARPDDFRKPFGGGRVVRTTVEEFADGHAFVVVTDPPATHAAEEVARRAEAHVGRDGYCPVVDNCEHFATWCATGRHRSRQVEVAVALATAAVVWVAGTTARAALGRGRAASA